MACILFEAALLDKNCFLCKVAKDLYAASADALKYCSYIVLKVVKDEGNINNSHISSAPVLYDG